MITKQRRSYWINLAIIFTLVNICCVSQRGQTTPAIIDDVTQKQAIEGKEFIEEALRRSNALSSYSFESTLFMFKPEMRQMGSGTYFFKKPNMVRLTIHSTGLKNGSTIVKQADGQIKVVGGNRLRFLKMNLDDDSRVLIAPNGYNIVKSDIVTLLTRLKSSLIAGARAIVLNKPTTVEGTNSSVKVVDILKSDQVTDRLYIDQRIVMPVRWEVFKEGAPYSVTTFDNIQTNLDLKDDFFEL